MAKRDKIIKKAKKHFIKSSFSPTRILKKPLIYPPIL